MKKDLKIILTVCLVFSLFYLANEMYFSTIYWLIEDKITLYPVSFFLAYSIVGIPVFLYLYFITEKGIFTSLGLNKNIPKAILVTLLFTSPMFLGYGISSGFNFSIDGRSFWFGSVFAAFFEELYYRGFFFGELYKRTRLGFIPAIFLSALIFGSLHLYQSSDPAVLVGIFITTFLGAALFAWLYAEWEFNLWIPIGMHFFMNLSWELFSISDNALGDMSANLFRTITIIFAIVGTILYKRKKRIPLEINRSTLLIKKNRY